MNTATDANTPAERAAEARARVKAMLAGARRPILLAPTPTALACAARASVRALLAR